MRKTLPGQGVMPLWMSIPLLLALVYVLWFYR